MITNINKNEEKTKKQINLPIANSWTLSLLLQIHHPNQDIYLNHSLYLMEALLQEDSFMPIFLFLRFLDN